MNNFLFSRIIHSVFFILFFVLLVNTAGAQNMSKITAVGRSEFAQMDDAQQRILIHQWNNNSWNNDVPPVVEQKALAYYKNNNIDVRIYTKYKILFKTVTNDFLPLSNRINACYFIIENYDPSIVAIDIVKEILDELILKSK